MDLLGLDPSQLTVGALLGIAILAVFTGWLTPKWVVKQYIDDRDTWRTAYEKSEAARTELSGQVSELLELGRSTNALIAALPRRRSDEVAPE